MVGGHKGEGKKGKKVKGDFLHNNYRWHHISFMQEIFCTAIYYIVHAVIHYKGTCSCDTKRDVILKPGCAVLEAPFG